MGKIIKLVVLNGGNEYIYEVGQGIVGNNGRVRKIEKIKDNYIVFLDNHQEIDILSNNILVFTQY